MVNDFLTGRVPVYFTGLASIGPHLSTGKVKILAVMQSSRLRQRPDLPSINETFPDYYNIAAWYAFFGPAALPRPIAERLYAETRKALDDPKVAAILEADGVNVVGSTPDELTARLKREIDVMGRLIRSLKIEPE
jgi:tripartite-type tricarboxylate transporter receptor subunit TctC